MIRNRFLLLLALPMLALAGCSDDSTEPQTPSTNDTGAIKFEIGFAGQDAQTRVATDKDFNSAFEDGDQIGIFAIESGQPLAANDNPIHNVPLTYNKAAGTWSGPAYWPTGAEHLSFFAYFPYDADATDPTAMAFTVKADQSGTTDGKSNYNLSDMLLGSSTNGGDGWAEGSTVPLMFKHALSMVQLAIDESADGIDFTKDATVTLQGVKTAASNYYITTGTLEENGDAGDVVMHFAATDGTKRLYRALIPNQIVAKGTKLFRIENDGRTLTTDALSASLFFGFGYAHKYTLPRPGGGAPKGTVIIPAAGKTFLMGSSDGSNIGDLAGTGLNTTPAEPNRGTNETQHKVTFTRSFYMSTTEITNAQYAAFLNDVGVGSDGKADVAGYGNQTLVYPDATKGLTYYSRAWNTNTQGIYHESLPIIHVTWYGAKAYADWVGGSLPTEAQWEYASRGGRAESMPFSINVDGYTANYFVQYSYDVDKGGEFIDNAGHDAHFKGGTIAVGSYFPNGYGLYDMHGNVMEWCSDWYGAGYYTDPEAGTDPVGPASGSGRVVRGGSWNSYAQYCRSAYRFNSSPTYDYGIAGFRVVFPAD